MNSELIKCSRSCCGCLHCAMCDVWFLYVLSSSLCASVFRVADSDDSGRCSAGRYRSYYSDRCSADTKATCRSTPALRTRTAQLGVDVNVFIICSALCIPAAWNIRRTLICWRSFCHNMLCFVSFLWLFAKLSSHGSLVTVMDSDTRVLLKLEFWPEFLYHSRKKVPPYRWTCESRWIASGAWRQKSSSFTCWASYCFTLYMLVYVCREWFCFIYGQPWLGVGGQGTDHSPCKSCFDYCWLPYDPLMVLGICPAEIYPVPPKNLTLHVATFEPSLTWVLAAKRPHFSRQLVQFVWEILVWWMMF